MVYFFENLSYNIVVNTPRGINVLFKLRTKALKFLGAFILPLSKVEVFFYLLSVGKVTIKVDPIPTLLFISISILRILAILFTIESPNP